MSNEQYESKDVRITVDVVVPVYNESRDLESNIRRLRRYLDTTFPFDAVITIADNASTDGTWEVARRLCSELHGVRALHLDRKGRGRALRAAWTRSEAEILAYMDVDLSTGLEALLPLVAPLVSGHSELAIGTRLATASRVVRGPKRELISRAYNALLRALLHARFSDAQCGFKAIRAVEAAQLLPAIADEEWFFDTELLLLAERNGLRIHEVPVDWSDDPDSRVHLGRTAVADLRGIGRLLARFGRGGGHVEAIESRHRVADLADFRRFGGHGIVNPLAYLVAYVLMFILFKGLMNSYAANTLALALCALGTFVAHCVTRPRGHSAPFQVDTLTSVVFAMSISVLTTTWSLAAAINLAGETLPAEVAALLFGSALAGALRFLIRRASMLRLLLREMTLAGSESASDAPTQRASNRPSSQTGVEQSQEGKS